MSYDAVQKLIALEESYSETIGVDAGSLAVIVVYLVFMQIRSYTVNERNTNRKDREIYCWDTFLWFTYLHTSGSTMMTNKRNMLLETVAFLFLVTRDDVSQTRRTTS